jgi:pimeloyl-ACP methyl ester carboxylesterase
MTRHYIHSRDLIDKESMPYVVHLVHGTWAGRARWTQADSKLCGVIRFILQDAVVYSVFRWSGWNRIKSRSQAADEFAEYLGASLTRFPQSKHFVVAHSHGGSIAYMALGRRPEVAARVDHLFCLGTPFLQARSIPQTAGPFFAGILHALLILLPILVSWGTARVWNVHGLWGGLPAMVLGSVCWWLYQEKFIDTFGVWSINRVVAVIDAMFLPKALACKVTIMRVAGDETTGFLGLPLMLATKISHLAGWLLEAGTAKARGALFIVAWAVSTTCLLAAGLLAFFIGFEVLLVAWGLVISVEATPPGLHRVLVIGGTDEPLIMDNETAASHMEALRLGGNRHSAIYHHPEAILLLALLIKDSSVLNNAGEPGHPLQDSEAPPLSQSDEN